MYRLDRSDDWGVETFGRLISASLSWFLYYLAFAYLGSGYLFQADIPRLIIFFTLFLSVAAVGTERYLLAKVRSALLSFGTFPPRNVLVLTASGASPVIDEIRSNPEYRIVAFANQTAPRTSAETRIPWIVGAEAVFSYCRERKIDEILSLDSSFSRGVLDSVFELARTYGIAYRYADRFLLSESKKTDVAFVAGVPVVEVVSIGLGPWGRIWKRAFDLAASASIIAVLSPALAAIALAVFLSDRKVPVYRSVRVGKDGQPFTMYKFRSMRPDADIVKKRLVSKNERKDGPLFKMENDPRVTRIGRVLRRYDLDELPQLFNVLIGNMSLVGPRPHLPEEVGKYEEWQKRVLTLKPGITGMAQVNGRHKNSFEDEVRLDVFYIEHWNPSLDLKILFKTVGVVVWKGGR